ncbi:GNAT family N-acetyltransferase [uncultured Enterovirga sp.]|uniref:GNAT family N-acetyltransferase n=1 Tax=uncultured Enterovirga sp. TaxID=2026352 RepID=UPI0035CA4C6E
MILDSGLRDWARAAEAGLVFRPIEEADLPFLERVYASTRADELTRVDWPEARKRAFVRMQFQAQHAHYQTHYSDAEWLVIMEGPEPIGRLYLERWPSQHRIIDITLLPEHRGRGLGEKLLLDLQDEAAAAGKAVSIHVETFNPAMRLYRRLGFVLEEDKGVYHLLGWSPPQAKTAS